MSEVSHSRHRSMAVDERIFFTSGSEGELEPKIMFHVKHYFRLLYPAARPKGHAFCACMKKHTLWPIKRQKAATFQRKMAAFQCFRISWVRKHKKTVSQLGTKAFAPASYPTQGLSFLKDRLYVTAGPSAWLESSLSLFYKGSFPGIPDFRGYFFGVVLTFSTTISDLWISLPGSWNFSIFFVSPPSR